MGEKTSEAFTKKIGKEWLTGLLKTDIICVTFIKKDGQKRWMTCTLNPEHIPNFDSKKTDKELDLTKDVLSVFDVDIGEWRSFRYDSIKSISFDFQSDKGIK